MAIWISGRAPTPIDWPQVIATQTRELQTVLALIAGLLFADEDMPWRFITRATHRRAMRLLRPARSALRRLIIIIAHTQLKPLGERPTKPISVETSARLTALDAPERLRFTLTDPQPDWNAVQWAHESQAHRPFPVLEKPSETDIRDIPTDKLHRQLRQLRSALNNIERHAKRFQRLMMKHHAKEQLRNTRPRSIRSAPLKVGLPPGDTTRPRTRNAAILVLRDCDYFARKALKLAAPP